METGFADFEDTYGYYSGNPNYVFTLRRCSNDVQEKQVCGLGHCHPWIFVTDLNFLLQSRRKKYYERCVEGEE